MYRLGEENLKNGDLLSSGVNFYYSLFHACISVMSLKSTRINTGDFVVEKTDQLPQKYTPLTHNDAEKIISQYDKKLGHELRELRRLREYLSYGPNVLYEWKTRITEVIAYNCKFPGWKNDIKRAKLELPRLITNCCKLVKSTLNETDFYYFMHFFHRMIDLTCEDLNLDQIFIGKCESMLGSSSKR